MRNDLRYPSLDAARSILSKIGVDSKVRIDEYDQDFEYTSCTLEELDQYLALYKLVTTTDPEKRVLGCYFLECLNEHIQNDSSPHPLQSKILDLLRSDIRIHETELVYWASAEAGEENRWPIAKYLSD